MVKKIAVATGTRAEFGLLQPLIDKIIADPETELQLIVTGMHLSPEFGITIDEIRDAGYDIADEIEILLSSDSGVGVAKSVGLATIGFADTLRRLSPDWLVVLGDRFEMLGAATAAMLIGVPIAHIHGGERTEGAIDESIRHSITKMAQLHFVSTQEYRKRVVQLGESPERVFHVGAIGLDRIDTSKLIPKHEIANDLGIDMELPWCTVTYHPVTTDPGSVRVSVEAFIGAMRSRPDLFFVVTNANADEGGRLVNRMMEEYAASAENVKVFDSLGSSRYLSCVAHSALVLGNSSSAIIEAPFVGTPSVDIGNRQRGRARGSSVITCSESENDILEAITRAQSVTGDDVYSTSPYYNGGAAEPILHTLKSNTLSRTKAFYDLDFTV